MSKKYFPNDWQVVKDLPDEFFLEHEFEEVIEKAWSLILALLESFGLRTRRLER